MDSQQECLRDGTTVAGVVHGEWKQDPREQQEPSPQNQSVTGLGRNRIWSPAGPLVLAGDQKVNPYRDPSTGRQG